MRVFWFSLGLLSLVLGVIGAFLPLLPTVPFLLLAAFGFARSSTRAHDWLVGHPRLGPPIRDWRAHGTIRRKVKWLASGSILAAFIPTIGFGAAWWVVALQAAALACVSVFIWTRPEGAGEGA